MILPVELTMIRFSEEYSVILKEIREKNHLTRKVPKSLWKVLDFEFATEKDAVVITGGFAEREIYVIAIVSFKDRAISLHCSCGYDTRIERLCPHLLFLLEEAGRQSSKVEQLYEEHKRIQMFESGYRKYLGNKEQLTHLLSFFHTEQRNSSEKGAKSEEEKFVVLLNPCNRELLARVARRKRNAKGKYLATGQKLVSYQRLYKRDDPFFARVLSCMSYVPPSTDSYHNEFSLEITDFQRFVEAFRDDDCVYINYLNEPAVFGPTLTLHLKPKRSGIKAPDQQLLEFRLINEENRIEYPLKATKTKDYFLPAFAYYGKLGLKLAIITNKIFPVVTSLDAETTFRLQELLKDYDWGAEKEENKGSLQRLLFLPLLSLQVNVAPQLFGNGMAYTSEKPKALWQIQSYHWNYRFQLFFKYGDRRLSVEQPESIIISETTGQIFKRDLEFEAQHIQTIRNMLSHETCLDAESLLYDLHLESVLRLVNEEFPKYEKEVVLECDTRLFSRGRVKPIVKTFFSYGTDWFDLALSGELNGEPIAAEDLDRLLANPSQYLQINGEYLSVDPHEAGKLETLRSRLSQLKDGLRIPKADFETLQTLREVTTPSFDERTERFLSAIDKFKKIQEYPVPSDFGASLRPYQIAGYNWLRFLEEYGLSGILADDMGLGKTVQALAMLHDFKRRYGRLSALVVAPKSLLRNWEAETNRFSPDLTTLIYHGYGRQNQDISKSTSDLILTTYATLRNDIRLFTPKTFNYVILDEAQNIKNKNTRTFKELTKVQAENRLALSGTPIENGLSDVKSIFDFLMPGFLGADKLFFSTYNENFEELGKKIAPLILRRKKEDVLAELPEKTIENLYVDMTKSQSDIYDTYFKAAQSEALSIMRDEAGFQRSRFLILTLLLRLRQICCHPRLTKEELSGKGLSGKLEALRELVDSICAENHKVLVFSQFSKMLEIIQEDLSDYKDQISTMTGKTQNRQEIIDAFKENPETRIFLMTLKVGGVGLNLTEADYVIIFDPWWNPASEAQAIDRTHRIGQNKPVFVYRLIAKDSIEEKVLELQKRKQSVADGVLSGSERDGGSFGKEELTYLFS